MALSRLQWTWLALPCSSVACTTCDLSWANSSLWLWYSLANISSSSSVASLNPLQLRLHLQSLLNYPLRYCSMHGAWSHSVVIQSSSGYLEPWYELPRYSNSGILHACKINSKFCCQLKVQPGSLLSLLAQVLSTNTAELNQTAP